MQPRVLVTCNDDTPLFGALTRVLHALGADVHGLKMDGHQPVLQSPEYRRRAVEQVRERVRELSIDVLLPIFEEAFFLAEHRDSLGCRTLLPAADVLLELHSKRRAVDFCARHDLPAISTLRPGEGVTEADVAGLPGRGVFFVKEDDSRGGFGTTVLGRAKDVVRFLHRHDPSRFVVQREFFGRIIVAQGIFRGGRLVDSDVLHKEALWSERGVHRFIPYQRSVPSARVDELLERVGSATSWDGMLEFECIDPGGGDVMRILEFNPRFSGDWMHSMLVGGSFTENTARVYLDMPPVPRVSPSPDLTVVEGLYPRYFRRQFATRPVALLDPRWPLRWWTAQRSHRRVLQSAPYTSWSPEPESSVRVLRT